MSFLFLNGRTLKGLRITLRLLGGTFPYNSFYITVNLNFTIDTEKISLKIFYIFLGFCYIIGEDRYILK